MYKIGYAAWKDVQQPSKETIPSKQRIEKKMADRGNSEKDGWKKEWKAGAVRICNIAQSNSKMQRG